jgi:putative lipoprotein
MSGTEETRTVHGEIILPSADIPTQIADLVVQVENVSRADAPSVVIGEQRQSSISLPSGAALPFAVEVPAELVDERDCYSVRVHIDVSGSGEVEVGDLVTTQSYPVLTRRHGNEARIHVERV